MIWIEALAKAVEPIPELTLVVLFGSAATDREQLNSDLDVGVLAGGEGAPDVAKLRVHLERVTGRRVELVRLDSAPPLLRMEVARHGRVLLERDPRAWALFRAHAMIDWWDWAPTARQMHQTARDKPLRLAAAFESQEQVILISQRAWESNDNTLITAWTRSCADRQTGALLAQCR